jgi:hypothetical protein
MAQQALHDEFEIVRFQHTSVPEGFFKNTNSTMASRLVDAKCDAMRKISHLTFRMFHSELHHVSLSVCFQCTRVPL